MNTIMMSSFFCLISVMIMTFVLAETATVPRYGNKRGIPCTGASNCSLSGCCLHGICSVTGQTRQKCYKNVRANGGLQPTGIWTETDTCPCDYNYYCYVTDNSAQNVHPLYGPVGTCHAIVR